MTRSNQGRLDGPIIATKKSNSDVKSYDKVRFQPDQQFLSVFKPYLRADVITKLASQKFGDKFEKGLIHVPFSPVEKSVLMNHLDTYSRIEPHICQLLPGRTLDSIMAYLADLKDGKEV
jgi:hypothetical protein